ncbi:hypothetical protein Lepto7375DRAFT_7251 [Leptolyngbya sp. PCC 7375]|nr:hypothetical protein Lepto7375DRAFT_7251 [Leptolyngbya sp. PCC 7375]
MKRKPSKTSEILAQREKTKRELTRLLTRHRLNGHEIDEEFAMELYEQHGIRTDKNKPYTVVSLKNQFTRYMKSSAEETRANFESYQELQRRRLENLLSKVMKELDDDEDNRAAGEYGFTHKVRMGYIKEAKNIISELSTLTGANAPVELLVSGRIQQEVILMNEALKEFLPEETFNQVAVVLEHVMGLSNNRLGEAQRERKQLVDALEAEVMEIAGEGM